MVGQQLRAWDVLDGRVLDVMEALPRERFVPPEWRGLVYADAEIPLGAGKLLAPPKLQGRALQALLPQPGDNVLEIGAGTGYMTACLALLAHSVTAVELHPELAAAARSNLAALDIRNADVVEGDGLAMEFPPEFDVICVNGSLPVADLPTVWNAAMHRDLGLDVPGDNLGCLQDVHWSSGYIGSFPTYTIGNLTAAQIMAHLYTANPSVRRDMEVGDTEALRNALGDLVWRHGRSRSRSEILESIGAMPNDAAAYLRYLDQKFASTAAT